jgi:hypothetical protein
LREGVEHRRDQVCHLGLVTIGAIVERGIIGERMGQIGRDGQHELDRRSVRKLCELEHEASPF